MPTCVLATVRKHTCEVLPLTLQTDLGRPNSHKVTERHSDFFMIIFKFSRGLLHIVKVNLTVRDSFILSTHIPHGCQTELERNLWI